MLEAVSLSPVEFTATAAFLANALEASPTGTTASHRDTLEILHTIATGQAHNGSAITPITMTGHHPSRVAILPILVTAPDANGSLIKSIATERVGLLRRGGSIDTRSEITGNLPSGELAHVRTSACECVGCSDNVQGAECLTKGAIVT